ncbi:hypothetical protein CHARACLAT_025051 [Characodon lateralis]|uniref:Uncharacterized protein n=1 Tax=Characodon lateralis TaxID=208331 RepID=A0ABU7F747_9TELE|nr:hypothetical protein [Characodon lateralis]
MGHNNTLNSEKYVTKGQYHKLMTFYPFTEMMTMPAVCCCSQMFIPELVCVGSYKFIKHSSSVSEGAEIGKLFNFNLTKILLLRCTERRCRFRKICLAARDMHRSSRTTNKS